jgi:carboxypeptidase Taq
MDPRPAYDELLRRSRERSLLASCSALLGWDEQTYMPRGGAEHRGDQMALLAGLHHERATDPRVGDLLVAVEGSDLTADHESPEAVNVREWRRGYDRLTKLPRALVEELARTATLAQQGWVEARRAADYGHFRPWLDAMIGLKRREAACLGAGESDYDALLDEYEPGAKARDLAPVFAALRDELVPLIIAIAESSRKPDLSVLCREYPVDRQRVFGGAMAAAVGFDFRRGRLDVTEHPFCTGIGPGDCRITTRYNAHDFGDAFFSILHEVGHALYEQGLAPEHQGTPMGEAVSLGVHESQSRLWENAVGRGRAFWSYAFPLARQVFHEALHDVTPERFHLAVNRVEPSLIRVQADEVTYNLHVLVRFELEQALLSGALPVADLPGAWNDAYRRGLGVTPGDDAEGCLQDIHWSAGLFGYFPTYTLGNLYGAQLFAAAERDLGGLDGPFARGDFAGLLGWLRDKVHRQGQRFRSAELIARTTGSPPDHRPLVRALREKFGELYGL